MKAYGAKALTSMMTERQWSAISGCHSRYWLNEFHFDGLRFDAVHAIKDDGPKHLLQELAEKRRLVDAGVVVSVGHSNATAAQTIAAADAGATMVTPICSTRRAR